MVKIFIHIYSFLIFLIVFSACVGTPNDVVSETKMEKILYDSYLGENISDTELTPIYESNAREIYLMSILKKYDVTKKQYDTSLNWYLAHLDVYTKIYDRVITRLKKEESKMQIESGDVSKTAKIPIGDTINLWTKPKDNNFTGTLMIGSFFSEIKNDDSFIQGDSIHFATEVRVFNVSHRQLPKMVLTIGYTDESSISNTRNLLISNAYHIDMKTDTAKKVNYIIAGFYDNFPSSLTLSNTKLIRIHQKRIKKK
ncbi:MAG: DUF4296 domain-containing protein [Bacteroidales bacterium]